MADRPQNEQMKATAPLSVIESDLEWLRVNQPNLKYDPLQHRIVGALDFCAEYDQTSGLLTIGCDPAVRESCALLRDVFKIEIRMDPDSMMQNGWPGVFEVGGRHTRIAEKTGVHTADLHFFDDGACCLGISYFPDRNLTIGRFVNELVVPFFYRLSYTDRFGINASRSDLWREYSHGIMGHCEYQKDVGEILASLGRNDPCLCGSGRKYKNCCQKENIAVRVSDSRAGGPGVEGWKRRGVSGEA